MCLAGSGYCSCLCCGSGSADRGFGDRDCGGRGSGSFFLADRSSPETSSPAQEDRSFMKQDLDVTESALKSPEKPTKSLCRHRNSSRTGLILSSVFLLTPVSSSVCLFSRLLSCKQALTVVRNASVF